MRTPDAAHAERLAAFGAVSTQLSLLGDRRLGEVVAAAEPLGSGIGGRSARLTVAGRRVFVKRVPLTDVERRPEHVRSTANVFGLPVFYQYGVGSAGFGAWRELAAHIMTTGWVLSDACPRFPLLYHWRVLPDSPPDGFADEFGGVDGAVAHWEGSPAVRERLEAIGRSSASVVLFLEHVPHTLAAWLDGRRVAAGREGTGGGGSGGDVPYGWVEEELARGTAFMSAHGFVHFDAHFANVLTDGRRLYFADLGLALSSAFELAPDESDFLADHRDYDRCYAAAHLLRHHLPTGVRAGTDHEAFLRDWVEGRRPDGVCGAVGAITERHARTSLVLDGFHRRLFTDGKHTPYPRAAIERALRAAGGAGAGSPGRAR